jgi:hypothetical protein
VTFINYTRDLVFDFKPDYSYLKKLIQMVMDKEKFEHDYIFDWMLLKKEDDDNKNDETKDTIAVIPEKKAIITQKPEIKKVVQNKVSTEEVIQPKTTSGNAINANAQTNTTGKPKLSKIILLSLAVNRKK